MSERAGDWLVLMAVAVGCFLLGVSVGNAVTRKLLKINQHYMLSSQGFCSIDGKVWWKARDGMCYAADEPREP